MKIEATYSTRQVGWMDASEADALVNVGARIDVWVGNFTDTHYVWNVCHYFFCYR
jgi:hypothetical protein